jgi:hypothetical protein
MNFKDWMEQQNNWGIPSQPQKPWKASKQEILDYWNTLPPKSPLIGVRFIPAQHEGSTYGYDSIRISGSGTFINGILSRLKDLLPFEGEETKLQLIYKQQVDNKTEIPRPNSYVLYIQFKERGSGKK